MAGADARSPPHSPQESPFKTFPELPERSSPDILKRLVTKPSSILEMRPGGMRTRRSRAIKAEVQCGETGSEYVSFLPVPPGCKPGDEFTADVEGQMLQVVVPEGVAAGDVLEVKLTVQNEGGESDAVRPTRTELRMVKKLVSRHVEQDVQDLRLVVIAVILGGMIGLIIASDLYYWIHVPAEDGRPRMMVGLHGIYSSGLFQNWEMLSKNCEARHFGFGEGWCTSLDQLRTKSKGCLRIILVSFGFDVWACLTLSSRRHLLAWAQTVAGIGLHSFGVFCFVVEVFRHLPGSKLYSAFAIDCGSLGIQLFGVVLLWIVWRRGRAKRRSLGMDADHFRDLTEVDDREYEAGRDAEGYEWDVDDPSAGCPCLWRAYGFTPAGLFYRYRNYSFGFLYALLLYIMSLPFHFLKTFDWNGIRRVFYGPPSEEKKVRDRGIRSTVVINSMLYRRSNIIMTVLFLASLIAFTVSQLIQEKVLLNQSAGETLQLPTFQEFQSTNPEAAFPEYTQAMMEKTWSAINMQTTWLMSFKLFLRVLFLSVALFYSIAAMFRWHSLKQSRYYMTYGWVAIIAAPFVMTFIPTSRTIDWDLFDLAAQTYAKEVRSFYQMDDLITDCVLADPVYLLETARYYVKPVCSTVETSLPYVMPSTISLGSYLPSISPSSLPWIGSKLPYPGTDLKGVHSFCSKLRAITEHNVTQGAFTLVAETCRDAAAFLFTDADSKSVLKDLKNLAKYSHVPKDVSQHTSIMILRLSSHGVKLKSSIPMQMSIRHGTNAERIAGSLFHRPENPLGCDKYSLKARVEMQRSKSILLLGPLPKEENFCTVRMMVLNAKDAEFHGLVILDPDSRLKSLPSNLDLPVAVLASRLDGALLLAGLPEDPTQGPLIGAQKTQFDYGDEHVRTAHGCRCKGMGFDSSCKVRPGERFDKKHKEAFPWCETAFLNENGRKCPVVFDLCVPPNAVEAVEYPSKECLPDSRCERRLGGVDWCTTSKGGWVSSDETMLCIPPIGLVGEIVNETDTIDVEGIGASTGGPTKRFRAHGRLLAGVPNKNCDFRLNVVGLEPGQEARWTIGKDPMTFTANEIAPYNALDETEPDIRISVGKSSAVSLQKRCPIDGVEGMWEEVPRWQFRHQSDEASLGRRLTQAQLSSSGLQTIDEVILEDQLGRANVETLTSRTQLPSTEDNTQSFDGPDSGAAPAQSGGEEEDPAEGPQDVPSNIHSCVQFVGSNCNREDVQARCGENQVCDTFAENELMQGYCRCAPGFCWSYTLQECVSIDIHAAETISEHKILDESRISDAFPKGYEVAKLVATLLLALKEGCLNLYSIIAFVMSLGPGLMISAWTTKLIFVSATTPGYFCYLFPWMYCPIAWCVYNIPHQLAADWRLSLGLAWMAFWPVPVACAGMVVGLHKPMSVPKAMSVVNNLLLFYFAMLGVGYAFLVAFILTWNPAIIETLELESRDYAPKELLMEYLAATRPINMLPYTLESFGMYFATCVAVTDCFTIMIAEDAEQAWRMITTKTPDGEFVAADGVSLHMSFEGEVVKDWLKLLRDTELMKAPEKKERALPNGTVAVSQVRRRRSSWRRWSLTSQEESDDEQVAGETELGLIKDHHPEGEGASSSSSGAGVAMPLPPSRTPGPSALAGGGAAAAAEGGEAAPTRRKQTRFASDEMQEP